MAVLRRVHVPTRYSAREVLRYAQPDQRRQLLAVAAQLKGRHVIHINAVAAGGGVAEIMQSFVPYLEALGVRCSWYAINARAVPARFFDLTKRLHNALQGSPSQFSRADWALYHRVNVRIASAVKKLHPDVLVVNDPQPLGCVAHLPSTWPVIYVSHIDTSHANGAVWGQMRKLMLRCQQLVFSHRAFVHADVPAARVNIFTPAIDPLALKQRIVPAKRARRYLARYRIPTTGPMVAQVSRFDPWKNPLGVIAAHHLVRQSLPKVQTLLVGLRQAKDDPLADRVYRDVVRVAEEHQSLHVFFHPWGIRSIPEFTMMVQNAADVIIQNSTREGFGLTVTEAMWKGKVVVGGPAAGIRRQIHHGRNGLIAKNSTAVAAAVVRLLNHPKLRRRLGRAAHASVRKHFLLHRLVLDHLKVYRSILG